MTAMLVPEYILAISRAKRQTGLTHEAGWMGDLLCSHGQSVGHTARSRIINYRSHYIDCKKRYRISYLLISFIVFTRLLINAGLNLTGVEATLGMRTDMKRECQFGLG